MSTNRFICNSQCLELAVSKNRSVSYSLCRQLAPFRVEVPQSCQRQVNKGVRWWRPFFGIQIEWYFGVFLNMLAYSRNLLHSFIGQIKWRNPDKMALFGKKTQIFSIKATYTCTKVRKCYDKTTWIKVWFVITFTIFPSFNPLR